MKLYYNDISQISTLINKPQYNGNIAATGWKDAVSNEYRGYGYTYDGINRLTKAQYGINAGSWASYTKFSEPLISYDANGNILTYQRYGEAGTLIDNLTYYYLSSSGNQLSYVNDAASASDGYKGGTSGSEEYFYDDNGNMTGDMNKNINENNIVYNYLDLPQNITISGLGSITYRYDAAGNKLRNTSTSGNYTDYISNFEYENGSLVYIHTQEGRIWKNGSTYQYQYFIKDHLGNTRIMFADADNNGSVTTGEVLQQADYYPFGMMHNNASRSDGTQKYLYNGKELQEETEWYDYGARMYDPALGRWHCLDNLAEEYISHSPYAYVMNNPVILVDLDGNSTYIDEDGNVIAVYGDDDDLSIYQVNSQDLPEGYATSQQNAGSYTDPETGETITNRLTGGEVVGETVHAYSFADFDALEEGNIVPTGVVDLGSTWAGDKIEGALGSAESMKDYRSKAGNGGDYDLKQVAVKEGKAGGYYYGSQVSEGVYGSARDAGNIGFGAAIKQFDASYNFNTNGAGALEITRNQLGVTGKGKNIVVGFLLVTQYGNLTNHPTHGEDRGSYAGISYGYNKYKK